VDGVYAECLAKLDEYQLRLKEGMRDNVQDDDVVKELVRFGTHF